MYAHYMQNSDSDCGIATIRTILEQLKYRIKDINKLYKHYQIDDIQGLSLAKLKEILDNFGVESNAYGVSHLDELKRVKQFPMVLVVENDGLAHYILVHEINELGWVVSNPIEPEIKTYSQSYLESIFIGYALCLDRNKEKNESVEEIPSLSMGNLLYREIMQNISLVDKFQMVCLMILKYVVPLLITIVMQSYIEDVKVVEIMDIVFPLGTSTLLLIVFFLVNKAENRRKAQIENKMQEKILLSYYNQKMGDIYSGKHIEHISGYFWNLFYSVSGLLEKFYLNLNIVYLCVLLVFLATINTTLMLLIVSFGGLFFFFLRKQVTEIQNTERDIVSKSSDFFQSVEDNIRNTFDINLLSKKTEAQEFVENKIQKYFKSKYRSVDNSTKITSMYELFNVLILGSSFLFLIVNNQNENISGILNTSNSILIISMVLTSISPVIQTWLNYETSKVAIDHIQSTNDYKDSNVICEKERLLFEKISDLSLENISFQYEENKIFSDFSLELKAGNIYGITGKNGVGKSTLIKLISGILDPDEGIFVINKTLKKTTNTSVNINEYISMYSAECGLYRNSLIRNIQFKVFNEQILPEERNYYNDIFNLGFPANYLIQNNGTNLSQGQKQKILLMRALFQEKSIYIFDEPSSNLDYLAKQILKQELKKLADRGKLVILISHEEELMMITDQIINL